MSSTPEQGEMASTDMPDATPSRQAHISVEAGKPLNLVCTHEGVTQVTDLTENDDMIFTSAMVKVLNTMGLVEGEVGKFRNYIEAPQMKDKPLFQWPVFVGYADLQKAVDALDTATGALKSQFGRVYFARCCMRTYLVLARDISTNVSNITALALKTMSDKTAEHLQELENPTKDDHGQDFVKAALAKEVAKLIKHSTEATNSVWEACDLLQSIPAEATAKSAAPTPGIGTVKNTKTGVWREWMYITAIICFLMAYWTYQEYDFSGSHLLSNPLRIATYNNTGGHVDAVVADMKHVCGLVNENFNLAAQVQEAKLSELHKRNKVLENALKNSNERIDNIWEALGPPNEVGTYYMDFKEGSDNPVVGDKRIFKLRQELMAQIQRLEARTLQTRKETQLTDMRLTRRMDKVERKAK